MRWLRAGIRLIERQELENETHLQALREAAKTGIADVESGCFQSFDAPEPLRRHLATLAGDTVGGPPACDPRADRSGGPSGE